LPIAKFSLPLCIRPTNNENFEFSDALRTTENKLISWQLYVLGTVFENTCFKFFFSKFKKTRVLRFLEMTCQKRRKRYQSFRIITDFSEHGADEYKK